MQVPSGRTSTCSKNAPIGGLFWCGAHGAVLVEGGKGREKDRERERARGDQAETVVAGHSAPPLRAKWW